MVQIKGCIQPLGDSQDFNVSLETQASPSIVNAVSPGMIRKLKSGEYRLYSRKANPKTGKRRNLGTFDTLERAKQHEREIQYFKRH
ncbi:hypothetical protein GCM10011507_12210 [Edaphobacter acidisoli]|uniref:Uncharacterized protein n=1 Tax=Edaphobacter acidisoli TaxID=2040573 RepID=A0A916W2J1_9BACT|nr:hypothetical protein GCM10011507_12210 [Edaphobacter acidisoli]